MFIIDSYIVTTERTQIYSVEQNISTRLMYIVLYNILLYITILQ